MKFRTRLLISFGVVVLIPLLVFGLGIRREMSRRVTSEYERRVTALVNVITALAEKQARFVPEVLVTSGGNGSGALEGLAAALMRYLTPGNGKGDAAPRQ